MDVGTITSRAMLVDLSISYWQAAKYDREASEEVARNHQTSVKAGRYNKRCLPQHSPTYQTFVTAAGAARRKHYEQTLPWSDAGPRVLSSANFEHWARIMREAQSVCDSAWDAFVADYPTLVNRARNELNGLFRDSDYPYPYVLKTKYRYRTVTLPIPEADDFRVTMSDATVAAIRASIEADMCDGMKAAQVESVERLRAVLGKMRDKLGDGDAIFRDSLFENARDMCGLLDRLNVTGDAQLTASIDQVRRSVLVFTPQEVRDDGRMRAEAAARVDSILTQMGGMYK